MRRSSLQRSFGRAAGHYVEAARFQPLCAQELLQGVSAIAPSVVVDLGCGVGMSRPLLEQRWPEVPSVGVDFALPMLRLSSVSNCSVCARAESLPLASASVDFVWSNLVLQWCDPALFASEVSRVLVSGGSAAISTLGPETFPELRHAFGAVDGHSHTQAFPDFASVVDAFTGTGLAVRAQERLMTVHFPDLRSLLFSIRGVGANHYAGQSKVRLGKSSYLAFVRSFEALRVPEGLPLTYQVLFLFVEKL